MSNIPKISIVTTVFNGVENIEKTIISVINQTYSNIEYIIIDGGSTDGTVDIVKKYSDKISYWVSEKDRGIYDGMNKGIDAATGEWILFRNCGDYFSSLSDVANVFENKNYNGVDIIACNAILCDKYGYRIEKPEIVTKKRKNVMPVWHPSTFIRTELHKKRHFDTKYRLAADHDFFYHCELEKRVFVHCPVNLSIFDIEDGASVKGQSISAMEHFFIHGGDESNRFGKYIINLKQVIIRMKLRIRALIPDVVMVMRRKSQGRIVWSDSFNYSKMVNNAITKITIDY